MIMERRNVQLLATAFFGGTVMSFMELASMLSRKEGVDLYFFGGMLVAGVLGIAGYIIAGADTLKTSFLSGVSAPQLLGGVLKAGAAGAKAISFALPLVGTAWAQPPLPADSLRIEVTLSGADSARISAGGTTRTVPAGTSAVVLPRTDSLTVAAGMFAPKAVAVLPESKTLAIAVASGESGLTRFLRGLTGQRMAAQEPRLEVRLE